MARYGAHGRPSLTIPADKVLIRFSASAGGPETRGWGFRVTVEAPVCPAAAEALAEERDGGASGSRWRLKWCQLALAASDNDMDAARAYLLQHWHAMQAEDLLAEPSGACRVRRAALAKPRARGVGACGVVC